MTPTSILLLLFAPLASGTPSTPSSRTLGELALARGQLGLAPCSGAPAAVLPTHAAGAAAALIARLHGGADGSLFIDADIAREPDGRWRIDRVRRAYREGPRCSEDLGDFVWRAAGDAGRWTVSVSRRYLSLRREGRSPLFFRYRPFEPAGDAAWTYSGRAGPDAIHVVMRPVRCEDADAQRITDWSIEFTLAGTRYSGCAWGGEPR